MPNGLRSKLSKLRFQGKITQEEYKDLIKKLEGHDEAITAQIKWERDTAIEQLKQLGYGLGEKVEPWDCVSRNKVAEILKNNESYFDEVWYCIDLINKVDDLPSVKPQIESCEDCVSREALRERFKWLEKATKYGNEDAEQQSFSYSTMMMYEIKDEIDNVIDSLPPVTPQQKWIPVSERLPKSLEDVLATDGVDMFVAFVREKTKGKYEWYSLDANYDKNTPIEAWMPLPEPYRESEGEE